MKMCRFIEMTEPPCCGGYRWNLAHEDGSSFVTCDAHLAEGIRRSGLPAYIGSPEKPASVLEVKFKSLVPPPGDT